LKKPKRRRPPTVKQGVLILSQVLERIWNVVNAHPDAHAFRNPVSTIEAFDYYEVIANPIDLSLILKRIRDLSYKNVQSFTSDFELMRDNCYKYNQTRYVELLPAVDELITTLHTELDKEKATIQDIEAQIERESKTRSKPRQKAKKAKSKKAKPARKKAKTTSESVLSYIDEEFLNAPYDEVPPYDTSQTILTYEQVEDDKIV